MAANSESENAKKQMRDVAKPGSTSADPTARPVIVGRGPLMKDPMVKEDVATGTTSEAGPSKDADEKPQPVAPSAARKVIQPPAEAQPTEEAAATETTQTKDDTTPETQAVEEATVDAVIGQAADKKKEHEAEDLAKKQQEAIDKLVAEKTYFVPIDQSAKRHKRNTAVLMLLLLIAVAAAGAYAIYSGLLDITDYLP